MTTSIKFKMNYGADDSKRSYTIADVADYDAVANTVRERAKAFNTYLAESTSAPVFVSTEGNAATSISDVQIISIEETLIEGV